MDFKSIDKLTPEETSEIYDSMIDDDKVADYVTWYVRCNNSSREWTLRGVNCMYDQGHCGSGSNFYTVGGYIASFGGVPYFYCPDHYGSVYTVSCTVTDYCEGTRLKYEYRGVYW